MKILAIETSCDPSTTTLRVGYGARGGIKNFRLIYKIKL